jgi:pyridoxamine 5'-phosphate oxidase
VGDLDIASLRRTYERAELREDTVLSDPIEQLRVWLGEAHQANSLEPNAMCVCTVADGRPSARMVLLRGLSERGLLFYTSYFSRKGREISANPHVAAVFYWPELERQVRVEGDVEQLSEDESDAYFASRPRGHQIGAWASEQSEPVEARDILDQRVMDYSERFEGEEVPRPHSWGGYAIRPRRIEFWQGRPNRMHDRLEFEQAGGSWAMRRLQP